jgi:hypothetical protein
VRFVKQILLVVLALCKLRFARNVF